MIWNILNTIFIFGSIAFAVPYAIKTVRGQAIRHIDSLLLAFFLTGLIAINCIFQ